MGEPWLDALREGQRRAVGWALAVPRRLAAGGGGSRLGRRSGSSLEFREHRDYQAGDDLRHMDWSASGRSDRLTVKLFHDEVDPHLDLLVDGSRSMALDGTAKGRATATLSAFFEQAARRGGFTTGVWLAADGCRRLDGHGARPEHWRGLRFEHAGHLVDSLIHHPPRLHRRGMRLVISDLLFPVEPRSLLTHLSREAVATVVIQVLARRDAEPEASGLARLQDVEAGDRLDLRLDADAVARYRQAFGEHQEAWRRACHETSAVMCTVLAEDVGDAWSPRDMAELMRHQVLGAAQR